MTQINVGDWIYAVRTNPVTGAVMVAEAAVSFVGPVQIRIGTAVAAFNYRSTFKRADVYTSQRDALLAYRETTVQLLLVMGRGLAKGHVTLDSIDEMLVVGGE